jgi:hypothetical protein
MSYCARTNLIGRAISRFGTAAALCLIVVAGQAQEDAHWSDVERLFAIADVHGAYEELVSLLRAGDIIDDNLDWIAGESHLVSVGDLLDRGNDSRYVVDLLLKLQEQAAEAGGRVHVVRGNHELMNLIGDLRYVAAGEYATYADDTAAQLRETALQEYLDEAGEDTPAEEARNAFDARYPIGYFGHQRAFALSGTYGEWLIDLPTIVVINGTAFVHGGLPPLDANDSAEALNARVSSSLERLLELRDTLADEGVLSPIDMAQDYALARARLDELTAGSQNAGMVSTLEEFLSLQDSVELGVNGPMWYRGSVYCKPILEEPILDDSLAVLEARRVVVGHTPTDNRRVQSLYDGKLIMLDTGMLVRYYKGRPALLDLSGDALAVQYTHPAERLPPDPGRRDVAYGMTKAELIEVLSGGRLAAGDPSGAREPVAIQLDYEGTEIPALFFPSGRSERAQRELAAYRLSEALGFDLVPPTVARSIGGADGALQILDSASISEARRIETNTPISGWCDIPVQIGLMYVFDTLIGNEGRDAANVYYRNETSDVFVTAHGETFTTSTRTLDALRDDALKLTDRVRETLMSFDEDALDALLGDLLSERELKVLDERRRGILERF